MSEPDDVTFFLDPALLKSAEAGEHNFIKLMAEVLTEAGLQVLYREDTAMARLLAETSPGYAIYHMQEPEHDRALTIRRAYYYPFWRIEGTGRRWEWDVALTDFEPELVDRDEADRFFAFWRRRLFGNKAQLAAPRGFIYVPLQGIIRRQRSFQACSPIEMLESVARRYPGKRIVATLHPKEDYTSADRMALAHVIGQHPRIEISEMPMEQALLDCDFVVTMNSSAAFAGYFFQKPAVLYGRIDFHHIAGNVIPDGEDHAFETLTRSRDFAGYVWWFLQVMSINGGKENAKDRIRLALQSHGWPL